MSRRTTLAALFIAGLVAPVGAEPLSTLADLHRAIGVCLRSAELPSGTAGSEMTVSFSLRRDGQLLGKPRITYSRLSGGAAAERAFVQATLTSLERCLPLPLDPGLGGALAGRPLRFRITAPPARRACLVPTAGAVTAESWPLGQAACAPSRPRPPGAARVYEG